MPLPEPVWSLFKNDILFISLMWEPDILQKQFVVQEIILVPHQALKMVS